MEAIYCYLERKIYEVFQPHINIYLFKISAGLQEALHLKVSKLTKRWVLRLEEMRYRNQ